MDGSTRQSVRRTARPTRRVDSGECRRTCQVDTADRINLGFGTAGYQPVIIRDAHHEPAHVFRYLRAADVCYVGSLHDGINLVAKESVVARDDERGALILSRFAVAPCELVGDADREPLRRRRVRGAPSPRRSVSLRTSNHVACGTCNPGPRASIRTVGQRDTEGCCPLRRRTHAVDHSSG